MNKWIKRIGIACLIPIALVSLLSIALYIPSLQDLAVRKATAYAERATGMRIGIGQIRLHFPLDLTIRQVEVMRPPADTLLNLRSLTIRLRALPLLHQQVSVEMIDLREVQANSFDLIDGMEIKGFVGQLRLRADPVDLAGETAVINAIDLSDTALTLILKESEAEEDTTSTPLDWVIRPERIRLERVALALQMEADSSRLTSFVQEATLTGGMVDLGKAAYAVGNLDIARSNLTYDTDFETPQPGLDPAHIDLRNIRISIDSIFYQDKKINTHIRQLYAEERSGLVIDSLAGHLHSDGERILIPDLSLRTASSEVGINAAIPWDALDERPRGSMDAALRMAIGKEDLLIAAGTLPEAFKRAYPNHPLRIETEVEGNLSAMRIKTGEVALPGAFRLSVSGSAEELADSLWRRGEVKVEARSGNLDFVLGLLPEFQRKQFAIPHGILLKGNATLANREYRSELVLIEDKGKVDLTARYNPVKEEYEAALRIDSVEPTHFLPNDSLYALTVAMKAQGKGMDLFSERTWARLEGHIEDIHYGSSSVSDVSIEGKLEKHLLQMDLRSLYPLAKLDVSLNASLRKERVEGMLIADVEHLDLYGMHWIANPLATSFQLFAEASSDLDEDNAIDVTLGNWELETPKGNYHPKTLTLRGKTDADTTRVSFHAGDLGIMLTGSDCIHDMTAQLSKVSGEIASQLERDSTVDLESLRPLLPEMRLEVRAGQDNPIYNYLQTYYIDFKNIALNATTSPDRGVRVDAALTELARDTMQIDTIRAEIFQDSLGLVYSARVIKKPYRKQQPFSAGLDGTVRYGSTDARLFMKDGKGETGLLLGIRADKLDRGMRFSLYPEEPIIAFRTFRLNPGNYIEVRSPKEITADMRLSGDENASLWIHSLPAGEGLDELHAELSQIDLGVLSKAFSYMPSLKGLLNADFQYAPSDSAFMVATDVNIDNLHYENERVGDLMFNGIYLPLAQGDHQVDVHLFRDQQEISSINALYQAGDTSRFSGSVDFLHFPLDIANPFIPDDMAKMGGDLDGSLKISGTGDRPVVGGSLMLDTASVYVGAAGSTFRFDTREIEIKDNRILFNKFGIYAYNKNPFLIDGFVDFNDLARMTADLRLTANNLQLLNVKRNAESLVYGRLFTNLNATAKGPIDALIMRGDLRLLGGTNITYVLKDSPLTVQDRMSGLVSFTSFTDTVRRKMPKKPPLPVGGLDMLMTIRIDPAVQMNVDLSPDQSNHINLEGGGDLSFQYTPQGDMFLNGRYTLSGGTIKYSIPVIPLKEFNVQEGSYVQWTGDPMDPTLSLSATERVRASVTPVGQSSPRPVNFDVGIALSQRLENLGLRFTLEAPEDLAMQEELASKGEEERAKLAVSMLVTGMYLGNNAGGGKVNVNMGDALSSFLQSEINNIAGSALKTVDISFGMETYDDNGDAGGGARTDYSFRFAKRFYNDRIRVVLGGRISTGENINNGQAQPFIDNVSVEYRLDSSGSRYVKLFHDKNYESLLEGEITETGAGVVLRKKMMRLRELFNFKKPKVKPVNEEEEE